MAHLTPRDGEEHLFNRVSERFSHVCDQFKAQTGFDGNLAGVLAGGLCIPIKRRFDRCTISSMSLYEKLQGLFAGLGIDYSAFLGQKQKTDVAFAFDAPYHSAALDVYDGVNSVPINSLSDLSKIFDVVKVRNNDELVFQPK